MKKFVLLTPVYGFNKRPFVISTDHILSVTETGSSEDASLVNLAPKSLKDYADGCYYTTIAVVGSPEQICLTLNGH
jgi:hypothetical protein